ncbi:MAG: hypothetical protein IPL53_09465 [Ignavibacteria bacterium]|nr:hypothetical protein [Ignavibacteria bacterium]
MKTILTVLLFFTNSIISFGQVTQKWTARFDYNNYADESNVVRADNLGNVYVFGSSALNGTVFDFLTIKYDSLGNIVWTRRYDGASNGEDYGISMELDRDGYIYVAGRSRRNLAPFAPHFRIMYYKI